MKHPRHGCYWASSQQDIEAAQAQGWSIGDGLQEQEATEEVAPQVPQVPQAKRGPGRPRKNP